MDNEKISETLMNIQQEIAAMKTDIESLKENLPAWGNIVQQREAVQELSELLTEEEGHALAAFIGE